MVLAFPYRPSVPNVIQVQPTNVTGTIGTSGTNPINASVETSDPAGGDRTVVLDGSAGYSSSYETDYPWIQGPSTATQIAFTTLNGTDAIQLTWPAGSLPNIRWGGVIDLPSTYDECWFTQEMRFEANWVPGPTDSFGTGKTIGLRPSSGGVTGCVTIECPDNRWSHRFNWGGDSDPDILLLDYMYYPDKIKNCGDSFPISGHTPRETLLVVELHFKLNSASNVADGISETRINGVLRSTAPNFKYYCGGEGNRSGAQVSEISNSMLYGGSGSGWTPYQDSSITLGAFKVEIPTP